MQIIADLQLHSRFSRAVSKEMNFPNMHAWAKRKGIDLLATGDWTHPMWMREIERDLEEMGNGLLRLRKPAPVANENFDPSSVSLAESSFSASLTTSRSQSEAGQNFIRSPQALDPLFLLATEVSSIYSQGGRVRRVHTLIWVPTIDSARKISQEMTKRGCNLMSDGRPIIGLTSIQVAELVLSIEPKALIIPAHAWTPWFSVFGSLGGFDSIEEAFGPYAKYIYAVETGLSSNPSMNWRIKELDNRAILSFSDAHSLPKLGREATVFEIDEHVIKERDQHAISYQDIYDAISNSARGASALVANENFDPSSVSLAESSLSAPFTPSRSQSEAGQNFIRSPQEQARIAYTIEFYPEEGKYHYTGHRACNVRYTPEETKAKGTTCPVCGKPLTVGVMERVEKLAGRTEADLQLSVIRHQSSDIDTSLKMIGSKRFPKRPPFVMLVPLQEIISECIGSPVQSPKVQGPYSALVDALGGEFSVLLRASHSDIAKVAGGRVAEGIHKVRTGDLVVDPGYDGVFGVVKLWKEGEEKPLVDSSKEQLSLL